MNKRNEWSNLRVWPGIGGVFLAVGLIIAAFFSGCADEEAGILTPVLPDTSFLQVYDLKYTAANDSGRCDPGLNIQWYEFFYSNYRKNCAIKQYIVIGPKSDTLLIRKYTTVFIQNGGTHYGITKWIDVTDSLVGGLYSLHIFYRHSDINFRFDTTFSVSANQSCD